jgi:hypothetical protein
MPCTRASPALGAYVLRAVVMFALSKVGGRRGSTVTRRPITAYRTGRRCAVRYWRIFASSRRPRRLAGPNVLHERLAESRVAAGAPRRVGRASPGGGLGGARGTGLRLVHDGAAGNHRLVASRSGVNARHSRQVVHRALTLKTVVCGPDSTDNHESRAGAAGAAESLARLPGC